MRGPWRGIELVMVLLETIEPRALHAALSAADALNLLCRAFANLCTISCSNPTESQGHMLAFFIG